MNLSSGLVIRSRTGAPLFEFSSPFGTFDSYEEVPPIVVRQTVLVPFGIVMTSGAHAVRRRAIAVLVDVERVLLAWCQALDIGNHLDGILLLCEAHDAVAVLDAQRGAIVLADSDNKLQLRALAGDSTEEVDFSQTLVQRCYQGGVIPTKSGNVTMAAHVQVLGRAASGLKLGNQFYVKP